MQKDIVLKLNPFRWDPSLILKNEGVWGLQRNNLALVKNCRKVRGEGRTRYAKLSISSDL